MTALLPYVDGLISRFGVVEPLPTMIHEPDNGRPCVHLTAPMPEVIAVRRDRVQRLNFQPRFAADPVVRSHGQTPVPTLRPGVIAARRGDLLILSVELVGPVYMRHPARGTRTSKNSEQVDQRIRHHWRFTLHDVDDEPDVLLAVKVR